MKKVFFYSTLVLFLITSVTFAEPGRGKKIIDKESQTETNNALVEKSISLKTLSTQQQDKIPNFSQYLKVFKEAANKLIDNSLSAELFVMIKENVTNGANFACNTYIKNSIDEKNTNKCKNKYDDFSKKINETQKKLDDSVEALRVDLEKLIDTGEKFPTEFYNDLNTEFISRHEKYKGELDEIAEFGYSAKRGDDPVDFSLNGLKMQYQNYSEAFSGYMFIAEFCENSGTSINVYITNYDLNLIKRYEKYNDIYDTNSAMIVYAGIKKHSFEKEKQSIAETRKIIANPALFLNEKYVKELKDKHIKVLSKTEDVKNTLDTNEKFVKNNSMVLETLKYYGQINVNNETKQINYKELTSYYDENLRGFIRQDLQGAFVLLREKTKGDDSYEYVTYNSQRVRVWDLVRKSGYASLAEHKKKIIIFQELISRLKKLKLSEKLAKIKEISSKIETEYNVLSSKTKEAEALWGEVKTMQAVQKVLERFLKDKENVKLFSGKARTLSLEKMQSLLSEYSEMLQKARNSEEKMIEVYKKYQTVPVKRVGGQYPTDYLIQTSRIRSRKWIFSDDVLMEYAKLINVIDQKLTGTRRRYQPIKLLTLNGETINSASRKEIVIGPKDIIKTGKIEIEGFLYPEAIKHISSIKISLDGGRNIAATLPKKENFTYSFVPKEGKVYSIKIMITLYHRGYKINFPGRSDYYKVFYSKADEKAILDMYVQFQNTYQRKDEGLILSFLYRYWKSGTGLYFNSLKNKLKESFSKHDEVNCKILDVSVEKINPKRYIATYSIEISGKNDEEGLSEIQKSYVMDEIMIGKDDSPKIKRTFVGHFWFLDE